MQTSPGHFNSIPVLAGLVWGLCSTRLVMIGMNAVIAYASRSLTKVESHYPAHKLEFLTLKWAVIEKFHEYLYLLAFDVYKTTIPWPMAKLDFASHCWVASLASCNFQLYYRAGKTNIDTDALLTVSLQGCMADTSGTCIQVTAVVVQAIQEAALKSSVSLIEAYSSHVHVLDSVEDSQQVACMTTDDWYQAQWVDPISRLLIVRLWDGTLSQWQLKTTNPPKLWQLLRDCNHLKLRWGILYRKTLPKESQEAFFQLVLLAAYREAALKECHNKVDH